MNKNTRMHHFTLVGLLWLLLPTLGQAQTVRTITGTQNNLQQPGWGATFQNLRRLAPPAYADGISTIGGTDRPNARTVSNEIFAQSGLVEDPMSLSDFCWVWGQFVDHDITLVPDQPNAWNFINVPAGDPWMDPFFSGQAMIPMQRSEFSPGTGTATYNPLQHRNHITAFIDAGNVYGSDQYRADWLRTFSGGKLKTSAGNLLPYNTVTGEYADPIDHDAPEMDDAVGSAPRLFVAGDVRANENPLLLSLHTLFVREHNRLCDELAATHPNWTDEQLYQHAKRMVGGYMAAILYEQWLPAMGVQLPAYTGYDYTVNPTISNFFSAAAFRLGHTLLNGNIRVMNNDGVDLDTMPLREAFFNPDVIRHVGDIDPFLKGMGAQMQQACDALMVDDVRNFLFGPPGAGGLDLAAINIQRGRERGIPHFNRMRQALGLTPFTSFDQITTDVTLAGKLATLYDNNIDNVDAWVGLLSETPMADALFGETIMAAMTQQFRDLRDGDRFYYEHDPALSSAEKADIKATMFRDIIQRNTDITLMQTDVFQMMPHGMICNATAAEADVTGTLTTDMDEAIGDVDLTVRADATNALLLDATVTGSYSLVDAPTCESYTLTVSRNDAINNGVSALDIVTLRKHILGLAPITVPERLIAADLNASGSLSALDIVQMRRAILGMITEWDNVPNWRFFAADTTLPTDTGELLQLAGSFGTSFQITSLQGNETLNLRGIKMGDVNGSASVNLDGDTAEGRSGELALSLSADRLRAGTTQRIVVSAAEALTALQGNLRYATERLRIEGIYPVGDTDFGPANYYHDEAAGVLNFVWDATGASAERLFAIDVYADEAVDDLLDVLTISPRHTPGLALTGTGSVHGLRLEAAATRVEAPVTVLYQNTPNPAADRTTVAYYLPEDGAGTLRLLDATGRTLVQTPTAATAGYHQWEVELSTLPAGLYYYQLRTAAGAQTKRLTVR